jgi:hypothetical protein
LETDQEKIRILLWAAAAFQIVVTCGQIERDIFGSQLNLLTSLNARPLGMTTEEASN